MLLTQGMVKKTACPDTGRYLKPDLDRNTTVTIKATVRHHTSKSKFNGVDPLEVKDMSDAHKTHIIFQAL